VDGNKVYSWANQAATGFFGEEVVGKEASFYFEGEQDTYDIVQPLFNGGENVIYVESWQRRRDGEKRLLAWWCRVLKDESGNIKGALSSAQDITESKLSEEKLIKSYESLKKTLNDSINTMGIIVEMRDPYTAGHQQKVADLSTAIAREMKLEDTRIDQLRMAALIHDIGKMYVPSDILSKPGRLSEIEFSLIKTHAQSGYDIVKGMNFPGVVAQAVLQHHERLDGSGYPEGLKGEDTLLEAKILAVADVIEAMAADRPYRPALGIEKALAEISKHRGRLYEPDVVDTCLGLFNSAKFEFR
jgi:putative nucleotidyltransferase with HDIG domain/PAS domain S-box-containing protein